MSFCRFPPLVKTINQVQKDNYRLIKTNEVAREPGPNDKSGEANFSEGELLTVLDWWNERIEQARSSEHPSSYVGVSYATWFYEVLLCTVSNCMKFNQVRSLCHSL